MDFDFHKVPGTEHTYQRVDRNVSVGEELGTRYTTLVMVNGCVISAKSTILVTGRPLLVRLSWCLGQRTKAKTRTTKKPRRESIWTQQTPEPIQPNCVG